MEQTPAPKAPPLSQLLAQMLDQGRGDHITVAELLSGIKTQALAMMLVLFALPNVVPSLPGTSAITGLPLVILTLQMMVYTRRGGQQLWLPHIIANRAIPRAGFAHVVAKAQPYLIKIERLLRPRLLALSAPSVLRVIGAGMLILSVMIMLPIPLGNIVPAISVLLIALGMTQRDGIFILAGIVTAIAAVTLLVLFYWTALQWAAQIILEKLI